MTNYYYWSRRKRNRRDVESVKRQMETKKRRKWKKNWPVFNVGQKRITNYYWIRKKRNGIDVETVKGNMETKRIRKKELTIRRP